MRAWLTIVSLLWIDQASAAPLRLSYSVIAPPVAGVWMAQEAGTFKKYDLDVELIYIPSSGTNIQALLRAVSISRRPGSSGVLLATGRGAPVVAIASMMNLPPMTLYVQPEISRAEQLKGVDPTALTRKVIDNSMVEKLCKTDLSKSFSAKESAESERGTDL